MSLEQEIYADIVDNCNVLLGRLKGCELINDTPEGRMIYQCRWLKEQVAAGRLILPVENYIHTLRHVSAENLLRHLASSPEHYHSEIGIYLYRLVKLTDGNLLLKPEYYMYAVRCLDALIAVLKKAVRPLSRYELDLTDELVDLKHLLRSRAIEPPLRFYLPDYPNFNEVYVFFESSIDDLPNGKVLCQTVANLIFEGVRPDTWTRPEAADRETKRLPGA